MFCIACQCRFHICKISNTVKFALKRKRLQRYRTCTCRNLNLQHFEPLRTARNGIVVSDIRIRGTWRWKEDLCNTKPCYSTYTPREGGVYFIKMLFFDCRNTCYYLKRAFPCDIRCERHFSVVNSVGAKLDMLWNLSLNFDPKINIEWYIYIAKQCSWITLYKHRKK